ncbi:MAG: hypothetical protein ACREF4_20820 [Gammaproteobacteria bacterium]
MRDHMAQCLRDEGAAVPGHRSDQDLRQFFAAGIVPADTYRACQFDTADAFEIDSAPG